MDKATYLQSIKALRESVPSERREAFDMQFEIKKKSPTVALVLSICLGVLGIDRFYLGNIGLGIGKLVTFGGLYIWAVIDAFQIMGATRSQNFQIATQLKIAFT
jgi:TM2 domain-containing membrane protein YozV